MPYDWGDLHQGNIPQVNREDAGQSDAEKALAEERSRGLRVPGVVPGKLIGEEGAQRGAAATDPRGLVFDDKTGVLRPYEDDDMKAARRARASADKDDDDKPATQRQQEELERNAPRRVTVEKK